MSDENRGVFAPPPSNVRPPVRVWCRAEARDGRICAGYKDHKNESHWEKHMKSYWKDGE